MPIFDMYYFSMGNLLQLLKREDPNNFKLPDNVFLDFESKYTIYWYNLDLLQVFWRKQQKVLAFQKFSSWYSAHYFLPIFVLFSVAHSLRCNIYLRAPLYNFLAKWNNPDHSLRGTFTWDFYVGLLRGNLTWESYVGLLRGTLAWDSYVGLLHGTLTWDSYMGL